MTSNCMLRYSARNSEEEPHGVMTGRHLEDQLQEILNEACKTRGVSVSARRAHLRQRLPHAAQKEEEPTLYLLDEKEKRGLSKKGSQKLHRFAKYIEKFSTACRINVKMLAGRKSRRATKFKKIATPVQKTTAEFGDENCLDFLGRAFRWDIRDIRKKLSNVMKIEDDIVVPVPKSVIYYV